MEAAIRELDRLIEWGAKKGIIKGSFLAGFQKVLKQIAEQYTGMDTRILEAELQVQKIVAKSDKIRAICRLSGMQEKTIEKLLEVDYDLLTNYSYTVQDDTDFRILMEKSRMVYLKSDLDINTIRLYEKVWKMGPSKHSYLQFYRDLSPHLLPYFDLIEQGATTNLEKAKIFLIQHHTLN
ncbi:MAG TPA: hypothetical protein DCY35_03760 [Prolixibacteraceae bacterium]|nr:hypothetical protein [Prolixibacteraceae bacterium]